ncbi:MAG: hypothetical protein C0607_03680 [Azoarcus sp.]|nr:MAG: hypothetical protein C0607_03680 [Azoarcus sp.]
MLVPAVKAGGIKEVRVSFLENENVFIVAVEIKRTGESLYLATRRNPHEPRKFKRVDVAIAATAKLIDAKKFTVTLE